MAGAIKRKTRNGKPSAKWHATFTDEDGITRTRAGFTDKAETLRYARRLEDQARKRRLGLVDATAERLAEHAKRPIAEHVNDYLAHLTAKGTGVKRRSRVQGAIHDAMRAGGWEFMGNITPDSVASHIQHLRGSGMGAASINARIGAIKGFTRWLSSTQRLSCDPLSAVKTLRTSDDRRIQRRALQPEEVAALLDYVESAGDVVTIPKRYTHKGKTKVGQRFIHIQNRASLYRLMLGTGFRVAEAAILRGRDFELDADTPVVRVRAGYTKNRKPAEQPIRADLADALRPLIARIKPGSLVWPKLPDNMAPIVRADLDGARAVWLAAGGDSSSDFLRAVDAEGRRVDAHAFRHTYCSMLARSSAPVRVVQELARHSDPRLTMNTYAHVRLFDTASALEALPGSDQTVEVQLLQTGTDNVPLGPKRATPAQHSGRGEGQTRALGLRRGDRSIATTDRQKLRENTTQCADLHAFSDTCGKATSETRTPDLSFTKAPLYQLS